MYRSYDFSNVTDPMFHRGVGSNWIPADNFFTTIKPERYRAWLQLLKDGNQNMIRMWGGGIYEPDIFYDLCDGMSRFLVYMPRKATSCYTFNV